MAKWKKIVAVSVVLMMLASAGTVYYLYKSGFFLSSYGDMDGYYFDFEGSSEIGICNVEMGETEITSSAILNTISLSNSLKPAGTNFSDNDRPVSHDNYLVAPSRVHSQLKNIQSKLFFDDENGEHKIAKAYNNISDMNDKKDSVNYKQSIVYVADAGQFILITYYKQRMSDVYNHLNYHGSFWSGDRNYASALIEKETGLVHKLSGLWCGCTYDKYAGTNDIMPSIEYFGKIKGEDAFLINLERDLQINNDNPGMFHDKRGLVTIGLDQEGNITYKELVTERNAGYGVEFDDDGNRVTVYDDGQLMLGKEFTLYKNGIVHYYMMDITRPEDGNKPVTSHKVPYQNYLYFIETGEKRPVDKDKIIDVDGYLCSSATYKYSTVTDIFRETDNLFPTSCIRYGSDGSDEPVIYDDAESYRITSENYYYNCIYRNIGETQTVLYLAHRAPPNKGEIDRVTIFPDGSCERESKIFDDYLFEFKGNSKGLVIYDHRIFCKNSLEGRTCLYLPSVDYSNTYIGYVLYNDNLIRISDDQTKLELFNLSTGTKTSKSFSETGQILYIYVDYDDKFILEGVADEGYTRGTMNDDGSFTFKSADLELDVVKKVKTD